MTTPGLRHDREPLADLRQQLLAFHGRVRAGEQLQNASCVSIVTQPTN
jgi:hypothetical protein